MKRLFDCLLCAAVGFITGGILFAFFYNPEFRQAENLSKRLHTQFIVSCDSLSCEAALMPVHEKSIAMAIGIGQNAQEAVRAMLQDAEERGLLK
jgi:hypothetical protein